MRYKHLALAFGLMLSATGAHAATWVGTIAHLHTRASATAGGAPLVWIDIAGSIQAGTSEPTCATHTYLLVKDAAGPTGKAQIAQLMLAYAQGKTVGVVGAGTCTVWSDGEDISEIDS